jgi:hypothetical protein
VGMVGFAFWVMVIFNCWIIVSLSLHAFFCFIFWV